MGSRWGSLVSASRYAICLRTFAPVLALSRNAFRPRYNAQLRFPEAQVECLRWRVDVSHIVPTPRGKRNCFVQVESVVKAWHSHR